MNVLWHLLAFASLALFGMVLVWLGNQLVHARGADQGGPVSGLLVVLGWMTIAGTAVAFSVVALGPGAVPVGSVVVIVALAATLRYRAAEYRALAGYLALAAHRGVPLSAAARAFARERGFIYGVPAARLAAHLDRGIPLDQALRMSRIRLPVDVVAAVRVGCRTGTLIPLLRQTMVRQPVERVAVTRGLEQFWMAFVLLHVAIGIVAFVAIKIVPTIQEMYEEMDASLPAWSARVMGWTADGMAWWLLADAVVWLCVLALLPYYIGWFRPPIPVLRRLFLRSDTAVMLNTLAPVIEHGHSLEDALRLLSQTYPRWAVRRRVARALRAMDRGRPWTDALRHAGMLNRHEVRVLRVAQRAGNLPWVMQAVAEAVVDRTVRRLRATVEFLTPALTVVAGLCVLAWASGLLMAVFDLIFVTLRQR